MTLYYNAVSDTWSCRNSGPVSKSIEIDESTCRDLTVGCPHSVSALMHLTKNENNTELSCICTACGSSIPLEKKDS